ncbi:MAG: hypothetical protein CL920_05270 [Deltaproteobacteria bacterium]|nr:hypothetical protein [Deltaproteobacteria bacterium]MBU48092.1 hypothetical protein [Deltaproteobacteria bacterium]
MFVKCTGHGALCGGVFCVGSTIIVADGFALCLGLAGIANTFLSHRALVIGITFDLWGGPITGCEEHGQAQ